jgi:hypothetical protein
MNRSSIIKIVLTVAVLFILYRFFVSSKQNTSTSYATMKGTRAPQMVEQYTDNMSSQAFRPLKPGAVKSPEVVTQAPYPKDQVPTAVPMSQSVDLLPKPAVEGGDGMGWDDFAPHALQQQQLLDTTKFVGIDTTGASLRNASWDIRRDPAIPRKDISPFLGSSIDSDPYKKALDDCS